MRSRLSTDNPFTCVTCEIEVVEPTFHVGLPFCCAGCAADGPCVCSYDGRSADVPVRHCLDIEAAVGSGAWTPPRGRLVAARG
jgi:hypothetical protein